MSAPQRATAGCLSHMALFGLHADCSGEAQEAAHCMPLMDTSGCMLCGRFAHLS